MIDINPTKAVFTHRIHENGVIIIEDLGGRSIKSVTNDAECVLAQVRKDIRADIFDAAPAVIYRDSQGVYDGMLFDAATGNVTFYSIGGRCPNSAAMFAALQRRSTRG